MVQKISSIIICISLFCLLLSCNINLHYEKFEEVNKEGWNYKNTVSFRVPVEQENSKQLFLALRNTADYEKANLWLFLTVLSPSGKMIQDTIDCPLADDYGYWLGNGFSGLYLTEHRVNKSILFDEKGEWKVSLTHGMRKEVIKGIQEVGILVKEDK